MVLNNDETHKINRKTTHFSKLMIWFSYHFPFKNNFLLFQTQISTDSLYSRQKCGSLISTYIVCEVMQVWHSWPDRWGTLGTPLPRCRRSSVCDACAALWWRRGPTYWKEQAHSTERGAATWVDTSELQRCKGTRSVPATCSFILKSVVYNTHQDVVLVGDVSSHCGRLQISAERLCGSSRVH